MESNKCTEGEKFQIQIDNIKEDVEDLKEYKRLYMETNISLKENLVRLTVLMEKQDERLEYQDKKIEKHQETTTNEIKSLRTEIQESNQLHTKWYQDFFNDNFGKTMKFLFVIILVLLGVKVAGIDVTALLK